MGRRKDEEMKENTTGLNKMERLLRRKPRTLAQLEKMCKVSTRTVYRWIDVLAARGCIVDRVGIKRPTMYQIVPGVAE